MNKNMRNTLPVTRLLALTLFAIVSLVATTMAQEVSIPDPGLNAAIREALNNPAGPLTQQELLSLTNLNARSRNVSSIAGLEAARNLISLNLPINRLTNFALPSEFTKLTTLDVSVNPLTNFSLPSGLTNLAVLTLESDGLANLTLPGGLTGLKSLDLSGNQFTSFNPLSNLTSLTFLDLSFNSFTNFSVPKGLTNLTTFLCGGNPLTNITLPSDLMALTDLYLSENLLTRFTLPSGLTNLIELHLFFNQLTNLTLPADLGNLVELDLDFNRLSSLDLPSNLNRLGFLRLRANQFTDFNLPASLTGLSYLDISTNPLTHITLPAGLGHLTTLRLSENQLTSLRLPVGLTNLAFLNLTENQLTNIVLPPDLNRLETLDLSGNRLTRLNLPGGLTNLTGLFFVANQLTNVTLPPDMTRLADLGYLANPLTTFVLAEALAATNLAGDVATLQGQGIPVFTYPPEVQLIRLRQPIGAFQFGIAGPPGVYAVFASTDLAVWSELRTVPNPLGRVVFTDGEAHLSSRKFYRAFLETAPANMVFILPDTFVLGSPANEAGRSPDEGPQTTVTISHGFWMGKHEVTQREYLGVVGSNPSQFTGDLNRPVESVSWLEATNYCALLTAQQLASGLISPGSRYRLPTEAEWEYAARAGTFTRFSYGEDANATSLSNYAWYSGNSGFGTHPVEQKIPNPWGLYDMEGNVLEWCLDWQGPYPGGAETDPEGPASNPIGDKIIRGGAWDSFTSDCRSARRMGFGVSPFLKDFILGFRVVLDCP